MPGSEIPKTAKEMSARSFALVDKYPKDPRAHLFRGIYLLEQRQAAGAEPYFREAARLGETSPVMTRELQDWNLTLLALTVRVQHRGAEARTIAAPLCANTDVLDLRTQQTLKISKLCR
jgi:hypothetical protein